MAKVKGRRALKWGGLALLWLVFYTYFAYLLYPYDSLRATVERKLKVFPSLNVTFEGLGASGTGGIELKGVKIIDPSISQNTPILAADRLAVRPLLLPLILRRPSVVVKGAIYKGKLDADVVVGKESTRVVLKLGGVNLASYPLFASSLNRSIKGKLDAKIDLKMEGGKLSRSNGLITVAVADGEYQPFPSKGEKSPPPMRLRVKHAKARLEIEKGKGTVKPLTFDGPDVEGNMDGTVAFADRLDSSRVQGELRFRFVSDEMKNMLGVLIDSLGYKKNPEGYYQIPLRGTLGHPTL